MLLESFLLDNELKQFALGDILHNKKELLWCLNDLV